MTSLLSHIKRALDEGTEPARVAVTAMKRYQDITGRGFSLDNPVTKEDTQSELWQQVLDSAVAESKSQQLTLDLEGIRWDVTKWEVYRAQRIPMFVVGG